MQSPTSPDKPSPVVLSAWVPPTTRLCGVPLNVLLPTVQASPELWSRPDRSTAHCVQRLALEQTVDAVFDLLRWPNGDFAFGMGEENPDEVGLVVPAEQIVGEATTRRESWEALSRLIPSPDVVLTMPVVLPENTTLERDEWALLALIDGTRSVGDLVEVSGAGQYTVVSRRWPR